MSTAIGLHLGCAAAAFVPGAPLMLAPKGTTRHRALGRLWGALMGGGRRFPLWIPSFRQLRRIHVFTSIVAAIAPRAILAIRRGDIRAHRGAMVGNFVGPRGAGLGALLPGRNLADPLETLLGWRRMAAAARWAMTDSNRRHPPSKGGALPTELIARRPRKRDRPGAIAPGRPPHTPPRAFQRE